MYLIAGSYTQLLLAIVLILIIIVLVGGLIWSYNSGSTPLSATTTPSTDLTSVHDILTQDAHLHRLLMIEIISDKPLSNKQENEHLSSKEGLKETIASEGVTFNKMATRMSTLGKALIRSFGVAIAQRIATLMHKRNEILREYYWAMRRSICHNGTCIHNSHDESPIHLEPMDLTMVTLRKLENLTREIIDNIAASFHIRDVDQSTNKKRPLIHHQRLFNLIVMYDKELINQATSYAAGHYDISMNCAQSSLDITHHISEEFTILIREHERLAVRS